MTATSTTEPAAAPRQRLVGLDVVRGIALIGVCLMNYRGYLVLRGGERGDGFLSHLFDPWTGPLSTRFAATFVTVAGAGVALMARGAIASKDPSRVSAVRWTLVRRGTLLFAFGFFFDWVWSGTILFFYGAYFLVAAAVVTLADRWLVVIGASAALAAAGIQWWAVDRFTSGHDASWLVDGQAELHLSPRELLFDVAVRGTHPLLPWLAFFCAGIVVGRRLPLGVIARVQVAFGGVLLVAFAYVASAALPWHPVLRSTDPFDRGLLFTLSALGIAVLAVITITWLTERTADAAAVRALAVAGRTTLTLYVLHALVFNLVVDWLDLVQPGGVLTALWFASAYWVVAIAAANLWHRRFELGPLEWVYRRFSA